MWPENRTIVLKDCTMREGLDVPGVALDLNQKRTLLKKLAQVQVPEVELVAPGHFDADLQVLREMGLSEFGIRSTGLIYGNSPNCSDQIKKAKGVLGRFDILMPLSSLRPPSDKKEKVEQMCQALILAVQGGQHSGVGFPHATQTELDFLLDICQRAVQEGAERITIYDTNGSSDPWEVTRLIEAVRDVTAIEICFHAHNDLGMATANSIAAVRGGADCLDLTINGLGDRAGNASLEQVALALHLKGVAHGLRLDLLRDLSCMVETLTQVPLSKLAPVVGEYIFAHKSPSHLKCPQLFEAFEPELVGASRTLCEE